MLRITLLGGLRVSSPASGEVVALHTRKARALLAYLAFPPGRAHPRDKLAALLWGERSDSQAHTSLRQALYGLRKALAPVEPKALQAIRDTVALEAASVEVDALRFEQLVGEGTPAALEPAVALYQGELLEGLAIDAPAFEEWLRGERDRLREQALAAMARLLAHQRSSRAFEAAVQTGLRLLALEPAQESVHRAVIRLQLRLGRRGAARRQYETCIDTLRRELGVEPEAETTQLYEEILHAAAAARGGEANALSERSPPAAEAPLEEPLAPENLRVVLARMPFTGRRKELERLEQKLEAARSGRGGLAVLMGEAGIGKTRLLEEFTVRACAADARVLSGRCFEGEFAPPFGPFAEAISSHAKSGDAEALQEDLGSFGAVVAKIVPELRDRFPDLPLPAALAPEEERFRLLDAVAQVLWALARRTPLVLVLDDLHWADGGTLALLRYLARFLQRHRVLLLGAYRDVELGRQPALADALVALRRDIDLERIELAGLPREEVAELLGTIAPHEIPAHFAEAITAETAGNPFFLREILLHLLEEGRLEPAAGPFTSSFSMEQMTIAESLREVIRRRFSRLSKEAYRLLSAASGCAGEFRLGIAAGAAGLGEHAALDALDEALEAQLVRSAGPPDAYDFTHALIRHAIYAELSPSRQVRLHRSLAEEMERVDSDRGERAAEIARQWHRSAAIPGAGRGVPHAVMAADAAEKAAAHEEAASLLGMALDLLPEGDPRRARLLARRALALAWSRPEEAVRLASEAGERLAAAEGSDAAADYLADAASAVYASRLDARSWPLAEQGLRLVGNRRDLTWALLASSDLSRRDAHNPDFSGLPLDIAERREVSRILLANWDALLERGIIFTTTATVFESRDDAVERARSVAPVMGYWIGDYAGASVTGNENAMAALRRGQLAQAALGLILVARCESALGNLGTSREAFARASELADRIGNPPFIGIQLQGVALEYAGIQGEGHALFVPVMDGLLAQAEAPENRWVRAAIGAAAVLCYAHSGRGEDALRALERGLPAVEHAAGWAAGYTVMLYWVIEALWILERGDHADFLERNLRMKTLAPDFRFPNSDARLAQARLCALTGRFDAARKWFERAREVLDEQGARPLRAVTDFDEAWMEMRRGRAGDRERALELLDAARGPFESIGMPGWLRRAHELRQQLRR